MTLKDRVKELANEKKLSLPTLEAELGFGNGTITKWDKSTPNADKLNKVAQYFHVTMDYLLNGSIIESSNKWDDQPSINDAILNFLTDYFDNTPLEIYIDGELYTCNTDFICNVKLNDKHYYEIDDYFRKRLNMSILTLKSILTAERFVTPKDLTEIITGLNVPIEELLNLPFLSPYWMAQENFIYASFLKQGYFVHGIYTGSYPEKSTLVLSDSKDSRNIYEIDGNFYDAFINALDDFASSRIDQLIAKSKKYFSTNGEYEGF